MPDGYNFLQMTIPLGKETKEALLFKTSVGRGGAGGPGLVSHNVFTVSWVSAHRPPACSGLLIPRPVSNDLIFNRLCI